MFALLKISDAIYVVRKTKTLKNNKKNKCTISYKGRCVPALITSYHNEKKVLEDIAKNLQMSIPAIQLPAINDVNLLLDNENGHNEQMAADIPIVQLDSPCTVPPVSPQDTQAMEKNGTEYIAENEVDDKVFADSGKDDQNSDETQSDGAESNQQVVDEVNQRDKDKTSDNKNEHNEQLATTIPTVESDSLNTERSESQQDSPALKKNATVYVAEGDVNGETCTENRPDEAESANLVVDEIKKCYKDKISAANGEVHDSGQVNVINILPGLDTDEVDSATDTTNVHVAIPDAEQINTSKLDVSIENNIENPSNIENHTAEYSPTSTEDKRESQNVHVEITETSKDYDSPTDVDLSNLTKETKFGRSDSNRMEQNNGSAQHNPSDLLNFSQVDTTCTTKFAKVVEENCISKLTEMNSIDSRMTQSVQLEKTASDELSCNITDNNLHDINNNIISSHSPTNEVLRPDANSPRKNKRAIEAKSNESSRENAEDTEVKSPETRDATVQGHSLQPATATQRNQISLGDPKPQLISKSQSMTELNGVIGENYFSIKNRTVSDSQEEGGKCSVHQLSEESPELLSESSFAKADSPEGARNEKNDNNIQRKIRENLDTTPASLEDFQEIGALNGKTSTPKLIDNKNAELDGHALIGGDNTTENLLDVQNTEQRSSVSGGDASASIDSPNFVADGIHPPGLFNEEFKMDTISEIGIPRSMEDIFDTFDDPELNISNEVLRDVDSSDQWNNTFDADISSAINPKLLTKHSDPLLSGSELDTEESFASNSDKNDKNFDILEEIRDREKNELDSSTKDSDTEEEEEETEASVIDDSVNVPCEADKLAPFAGALDNSKLSAKPRTKSRQDFCVFCYTMQTNISRHLGTKHKGKAEVIKFNDLPKGSAERAQLIDTLRKAGNYLYNTNPEYNKDGQLLVARRPPEERPATQYSSCHNCKGTFSKNSIRRHRQRCIGASTKGTRANIILSRRVEGRLHENASEKLQKVFSVLTEDGIVRPLRYDDLIIEFGNGLCTKYTKDQQHGMIRNRIRTLGRLLYEMKECRTQAEPEITDFASIYDPGLYDCMLRAVNTLAGFDPETGEHKSPSVVTSLGIYVKACAEILLLMVIKKKDPEKRKLIEDYLFIHQKQYNMKINRVAYDAQAKKKRENKKPLPTTEDIQKLQNYVVAKRQKAYEELERGYSYSSWLELAQSTLISIMVFNRRRAGESERIRIDDLKNCEKFDEKTHLDEYKLLDQEQKEEARRYGLFIITGKLGNNVPVLLDAGMEQSLSMILQYRDNAKIPRKNPYIFGLGGFSDGRFKYLSACSLMREYSEQCGAEFPERLRGTFLRKHLATMCAAQNMQENEVVNIAKHMGHHIDIHKSHYRQAVVNRDVIAVSRALRGALGEENVDKAGPSRISNDVSTCESREQAQHCDTDASDFESPRRQHVPVVNKLSMEKKRRIIIPDSDSEPSGDEYQPSGNDSESDSEQEPPPKRRRMEISDKKVTSKKVQEKEKSKKPRWANEEKAACLAAFGEKVRNHQLPKTSEIKKFLEEHPEVKRTVSQIRTWASNMKQNKYKKVTK